MTDTIDGSWAVTFFAVSMLMIVAIEVALRYVPRLRAWKKERNRLKEAAKQLAANYARIEGLELIYQMQVAGRKLRAQGIDSDIRQLRAWIDQEKDLLDKHQLDRLIPVQERLIYALEYATERKHTGVSPAEFRDVVEGRRRQPITS
jgi:hypothetical protein